MRSPLVTALGGCALRGVGAVSASCCRGCVTVPQPVSQPYAWFGVCLGAPRLVLWSVCTRQ